MNWHICGEYKIEDGLLVPVGNIASWYDLAEGVNDHDLLSEFGKLKRGDEDGLLRLIGRWGMLAANEVGAVESADGIVQRLRTDGEATDWIWGHAENVRSALTLRRLLQEEDRDLETYLESLFGPVDLDGISTFEGSPALTVYLISGSGPRVFRRWLGDPVQVAEECVAQFLNPNLDEPQFEILTAPLRVERVARSLIQEVYWRLASLATGSRRIGRCEECGAMFEAHDERQRFCPAPRDSQDYAKSKGTRAESNCAYANRKRRSRRSAKAKEEES